MLFCNLDLKTEEEWDLFDNILSKHGYTMDELLFVDRENRPVIINDPELASLKSEVVQSWDRIFDIDAPYIEFFEGPQKSIQATFWELKAEQIKRVWHFKCR